MGLLVGRGWENSQEHSRPFLFPELLVLPGSPRPTIYTWMFQLDDEPNLYIENGWKSPFPSIYKRVVWGSRYELTKMKHLKYVSRNQSEGGCEAMTRGVCIECILVICETCSASVY